MQPRGGREAAGEGLDAEEFHHQVGAAVMREAVVFDPHHVGVPQLRRDARLAEKAVDRPLVAGHLRQQHLHRHRVAEHRMFRAKYLAHGACIDLLEQHPAVTQDVTGLCHGRTVRLYRPGHPAANRSVRRDSRPPVTSGRKVLPVTDA